MFSDVACRHNIHFNVKVYSYKGGYLLAEIIYMLRERSCYQGEGFFWVIYLQANNRTPTRHDYRVKCEETGESIVIPVGSVRVMMMTAKELRELGLYLLIPFLQLKTRRLVYEMRKEVKNNLIYDCKIILNDSIIELKGIFEEGILSSEEYGELMAIQQKIMRYLYQSIPEIVERKRSKIRKQRCGTII